MKLVLPRMPMGVPATMPMTSPFLTRRSSRRRFSARSARPSIFLMSEMSREVTPQRSAMRRRVAASGEKAITGDEARGEAAVGEDGDELHMQFAGSVADKFGNGFRNLELLLRGGGARVFLNAGFGFMNDASHHGNGFDGIFSGSGFCGEHHGVGAVEDGVGDVGGFGARGAGILGHGFEHLGGGDNRTAEFTGAGNDIFLDNGNFFRIHFDAEISAGDHDAVRDAQ